jgi:hypothetical protein
MTTGRAAYTTVAFDALLGVLSLRFVSGLRCSGTAGEVMGFGVVFGTLHTCKDGWHTTIEYL